MEPKSLCSSVIRTINEDTHGILYAQCRNGPWAAGMCTVLFGMASIFMSFAFASSLRFVPLSGFGMTIWLQVRKPAGDVRRGTTCLHAENILVASLVRMPGGMLCPLGRMSSLFSLPLLPYVAGEFLHILLGLDSC